MHVLNPRNEMAETPIDFVAEFGHPERAEWLAAVDKAIRGADFDRKLVLQTAEGARVQPLYRGDDAGTEAASVRRSPAPEGRAGSWSIRQELHEPTSELVRARILEELGAGADSVHLVLDAAFSAGLDAHESDRCGVGGVSASSGYELARALGEVDLSTTHVTLDGGANVLGALASLIAVARRARCPETSIRAAVGADPMNILLREGTVPAHAYHHIAATTRWCETNAPGIKTWTASARSVHAAGADAATELGVAIASAVQTLRRLESLGVPADIAASHVEFRFFVANDLFMEVAKLRGARTLWARVLEASGADPSAAAGVPIHCTGSPRARSRRDPWVNLLRGTSECFAAIVGGATSISVTPFDDALGAPDTLARRLSRNTQLVLRLEAHLDAVADPAGGSWYVEALTSDLSARAWSVLQEIEALGGLEDAVAAGFVTKRVAAAQAIRSKNIGRRKAPLTGVSSFAIAGEELLEREARTPNDATIDSLQTRSRKEQAAFTGAPSLPQDAASLAFAEAAIEAIGSGATIGQLGSATRSDAITAAPLSPVRDAERFEGLAARASALSMAGVFVAPIGPLPSHKARSSWVANFLAAAGLASLGDPAYADENAALSAFQASGASVLVIVTPDSTMADVVPALAPRVRAAGARRILVAGRTEDAAVRAAVDDSIYAGCDVIHALQEILAAMEASA